MEGETCEIAGVGPIPVATVREWLDDAFIAVVLTKGEDVQKVVHLGRRFTATQRTALQWQDPICARQGCSNRLRLEYDHFEDWADTHTTRVHGRQAVLPPLPPAQVPPAGGSPSPTPTASAPSPHPPPTSSSPTPPPPPSPPNNAAAGEPPDPHPHSPTPGDAPADGSGSPRRDAALLAQLDD